MTESTGDATEIASASDDLVHRHPDAAHDLVHQVVADAFQQFADARIRTYVPALVARAADERLRQLTADERAAKRPISA